MNAVVQTPWAILPEKLAAIVDVVQMRARGDELTDDEIRARVGRGPASREAYSAGTVGVLPLYGVIFPRANLFTEMSGGTSVQGFQQALRGMLGDDQVRSILIDIDSPGGSTDLIPELAAEIRAARGRKPIVALANTDAASAAYWLGAQADEFVVTPSGKVGSIGVFAAHDDVSGMQEKVGVKTTLVSAGKFKVETSPFGPLTDEAREAIQKRVDEFYGMFVRDVAKGRGVAVDTVRGGFGEGRMVTAKAAVEAGMADRVGTLEETLATMARKAARRPPSGASTQVTVTGGVVSPSALVEALGAGLAPPPPAEDEDTDKPQAAKSGLSFADDAEDLRDRADALVDRVRSLAEVRRGRLTAAKRDQLTETAEGLMLAAASVVELLAETDPNRHRDELARQRARYERTRFDERSAQECAR